VIGATEAHARFYCTRFGLQMQIVVVRRIALVKCFQQYPKIKFGSLVAAMGVYNLLSSKNFLDLAVFILPFRLAESRLLMIKIRGWIWNSIPFGSCSDLSRSIPPPP